MLELPGSPQIEANQDLSSDELYRPEGQPKRSSTSAHIQPLPQANLVRHKKVEQKTFSQIELVAEKSQFSVESLPKLPVKKKFDCTRCCWKLLAATLLLSCVALGVLLIFSMQKEKDLQYKIKELEIKLENCSQHLQSCKKEMEAKNDSDQLPEIPRIQLELQKLKEEKEIEAKNDSDQLPEIQRIRLELQQLKEAAAEQEAELEGLRSAAKDQDERAHAHSLQIQSFREKKDKRDDEQDERVDTHSIEIQTLREHLAGLNHEKEEESSIASSTKDEDRSGVKVENVKRADAPKPSLSAAHD